MILCYGVFCKKKNHPKGDNFNAKKNNCFVSLSIIC